MVYTLHFSSSKCSLFHNSNVFGSCIIHILYTGCAKIKKKNNSGTKSLRCYATNRKVAASIPADVSGCLIDIKSFRSHYDPGVDSASNRNEYREYFLGVKSGRFVRLTTYHHPVPLSRNLTALTSWNLLGLSRSVMVLL